MGDRHICIVGGGPAGLMAAEVLLTRGYRVTVCDAMPTFGRKFLLAGKSGLNITHSEDFGTFRTRFAAASGILASALDDFTPDHIRRWALDLGTETFVGSSGRVFPIVMKASPLLRAWLKRLESNGARLLPRHRMTQVDNTCIIFETPAGTQRIEADAVLLALGGASWPRLGSDAAWVPELLRHGVQVSPFRPANCGFDIDWSDLFRERFAGVPVKSVVATSRAGNVQGEFVISRHGIEGSLIYAHAAALRDEREQSGKATLFIDLAPGRSEDKIAASLTSQPAKASLSNRLRKAAGLDGVKAALLRELAPPERLRTPLDIAAQIKSLALPVMRPRPIAEAISSAGGVAFDAIDEGYMVKSLPGVFVAGEMIDWEAPTGGYLLTACFATGRAAAGGIHSWLSAHA
jgi:uncharacterized flavoprotein (TIGR03862 family)